MSNTAAPSPPPIIEVWRVALMSVVIGAIVLWAHLLVGQAHADTIGFRIEVRACRADACQLLPMSSRRWAGAYACQSRAALMERFADALPALRGLPPGARTVRVRCVPVVGLAGA